MSALPAGWCCISYIRKFKIIPFILMIFPPGFNFVSVQFGLRGKEPRLVPLVKFYYLTGKLSVRFGTAYYTEAVEFTTSQGVVHGPWGKSDGVGIVLRVGIGEMVSVET